MRQDAAAGFDARLFDTPWLEAEGLLTGRPAGGRGDALFLNYRGEELVLRHYRRGGAVRHLSRDRYLWLGRQRSRVAREMTVLLHLEGAGVPVGRAYAGRLQRTGVTYRCSLLTRRAPGDTLASLLGRRTSAGTPAGTPAITPAQWRALGASIARMHDAGVWHADLNAHNLLLEGETVTLIDFDRARMPTGDALPARDRQANLRRLESSLHKLAGQAGYSMDEEGWQTLVSAAR